MASWTASFKAMARHNFACGLSSSEITTGVERSWGALSGEPWLKRVGRFRSVPLLQTYAVTVPGPAITGTIDEMVIVIRRKRCWFWRAVENEGEVLGFLVQSRRNAKATKKLMRKLLKKQGFAPSRIVTDILRSYPTAFRAIGLTARHDCGLRANNRAENSHQPVRRRERKLQKFKSLGSAQHFLSIHSATYNTFYHQRHLNGRAFYRELRTASFDAWETASAAA
jgi:hypothetical protein